MNANTAGGTAGVEISNIASSDECSLHESSEVRLVRERVPVITCRVRLRRLSPVWERTNIAWTSQKGDCWWTLWLKGGRRALVLVRHANAEGFNAWNSSLALVHNNRVLTATTLVRSTPFGRTQVSPSSPSLPYVALQASPEKHRHLRLHVSRRHGSAVGSSVGPSLIGIGVQRQAMQEGRKRKIKREYENRTSAQFARLVGKVASETVLKPSAREGGALLAMMRSQPGARRSTK